jgi:DNA-binding CsgD family transcriptional regulator
LILALTRRQAEVARLLAVECLTAKAIGRRLGITTRTVETHRTNIFNKLDITRGIAQFARMMAIHGPQCGGRKQQGPPFS